MSDRRIEILNQGLAAVGETDVAIIDAAELARLRRNSERWEWLAEFGFYKCSGGSLSLRLNVSNREDLVEAVDAAIVVEQVDRVISPT